MEIIQVVNKQTLKIEKTYRLTNNQEYTKALLKGLEATFDDHKYWLKIKFIDPKFWQ